MGCKYEWIGWTTALSANLLLSRRIPIKIPRDATGPKQDPPISRFFHGRRRLSPLAVLRVSVASRGNGQSGRIGAGNTISESPKGRARARSGSQLERPRDAAVDGVTTPLVIGTTRTKRTPRPIIPPPPREIKRPASPMRAG